jgi:cytochrome c peroxidase
MSRRAPARLSRAGARALAALCTLASLVVLAGCAEELPPPEGGEQYAFALPAHFPAPVVPPSNPMTPEKVELGRHLFFDERLSGNGTQSCASCHDPALAFSDGLDVSVGSTGQHHSRNAMALVNQAYNSAYTWANPSLATLEQQILVPIFGEFPVELGVTGHEAAVLARFRDDPAAAARFAAAFPDRADPVSFEAIVDALACFVRSLVSADAPYDRYLAGDRGALSASAIRGMELFFSERLECHHCHGGFNFAFSTTHADSAFTELSYHNTGLYDVDGAGAYPTSNEGLFEVTGNPRVRGRFRAPTLRNVAASAPYMHDGSILTLEEVVRTYESGGRLVEDGPWAGDGRGNPNKSGFVRGFIISDAERADLLAFLESLTDASFLANPAFQDPATVE